MDKPPTVAPISPQELKAGRDVLLANAALWKIISARLSARTIDEIADATADGATLVIAGGVDGLEQTRVVTYVRTGAGRNLVLSSMFVSDLPPVAREPAHN